MGQAEQSCFLWLGRACVYCCPSRGKGSKEPPGPGLDEPRQEGVGHQQGGQTPPLLGRGQRSLHPVAGR